MAYRPIEGREVGGSAPSEDQQFPGVSVLTLKRVMGEPAMRDTFGQAHFDYMPRTFVLPAERAAWEVARRGEGSNTPVWVMKPSNSSRSRGIWFVRSKLAAGESPMASTSTSALEEVEAEPEPDFTGIASAYVHPPLLLDGCKFDVRLFVLVTSWHPLVVYIFDDGIARCAASPYSLDGSLNAQPTAHFTNASISGEGRRHMLPELRKRFVEAFGAERSSTMWRAVDDLVVKMMLTVEGRMAAELRASSLRVASGHPNTSCFELFGIDVIFSNDGKPWLLEANLDPSLSIEDVNTTPKGANAHLKCSSRCSTSLVSDQRLPKAPRKPCSSPKTHQYGLRKISRRWQLPSMRAWLRHLDYQLSKSRQQPCNTSMRRVRERVAPDGGECSLRIRAPTMHNSSGRSAVS